MQMTHIILSGIFVCCFKSLIINGLYFTIGNECFIISLVGLMLGCNVHTYHYVVTNTSYRIQLHTWLR